MSAHGYRQSFVSSSFQRIINAAALTDHDVAVYKAHRVSIRNALANATLFELYDVVLMGSFSRLSAVHGSSDADLLAVLRKRSVSYAGSPLHSSTTVLTNMRNVLRSRFHATDVGKDGQAIVVDFGDGEHPVDVVPAVWWDSTGLNNYPVHVIPDGSGGWMRTSPSSHNLYINNADERAGGKLKCVAQVFKTWCNSRTTQVPISGFHVELLLASTGDCEGARSYANIFRDLLIRLRKRDCVALNDPVGISGRIPAAATEAKRESAMRTLADAAYHADCASLAEAASDEAEAWRQWNLVFNDQFPR